MAMTVWKFRLTPRRAIFIAFVIFTALYIISRIIPLGDIARLVVSDFGTGHKRIGPLPGDVVTYNPFWFRHPNTVPNGGKGEDFFITEIKGDGWSMLDSGPGFIHPGHNKFKWVDENTVVFTSINAAAGAPLSKALPGNIYSGLYVWDLKQNRIYRRNDLPHFIANCVANGYASFLLDYLRDEKNKIVGFKEFQGKWGHEKEVETPTAGLELKRNAHTCFVEKKPEEYIGKFISQRLLPGHGFLLTWDQTKKGISDLDSMYWKLINKEKKINQELPFNSSDALSIHVQYFEFQKAYLVKHDILFEQETIAKWKQTNCLPYWWLFPSGQTEQHCVPLGPWVERQAHNTMPTREGLIVFSKYGAKGTDGVPIRGIYRVKPDQIEKILTGWVDMGADYNMSPDGCKIAFGFSPTIAASTYGPGTVRILDLCK